MNQNCIIRKIFFTNAISFLFNALSLAHPKVGSIESYRVVYFGYGFRLFQSVGQVICCEDRLKQDSKCAEWRQFFRVSQSLQDLRYLWISMFLNVHLCKWTDIPNTGDVDGKLMIEVYNVGGLVSQTKAQNKRRYERTQQFLHEKCLTNTKHTFKHHSDIHLQPIKCPKIT